MCLWDGLEAFREWVVKWPSPLSPTLLCVVLQRQDIFPSQHLRKKEVWRVLKGCARHSLWLSWSPENTWGIFLRECLSGHSPPPQDRRVISDQQQEMEANVLTPKTFYSFCLVLHLPPRAAAFISPFEWPTGLHSPEEQRKCLFSWNPWKTTKDFSSCRAISHHFQQ